MHGVTGQRGVHTAACLLGVAGIKRALLTADAETSEAFTDAFIP